MEVIKDSVAIAWVHPNIVTEGFARSLANLCRWPLNNIGAMISVSNPRAHVARNAAIEEFLASSTEYLMWIDTDMTFEHNSIERLMATMKRYDADIAAGLAFVLHRTTSSIQPNCWLWSEEDKEWKDVTDFKSGEVLRVDAVGSAFVLIHRSVFEASGPAWHRDWISHPASGDAMGHDLSFFYDACVAGDFKLVYDTGIEAGHVKHIELREAHFRDYQRTTK